MDANDPTAAANKCLECLTPFADPPFRRRVISLGAVAEQYNCIVAFQTIAIENRGILTGDYGHAATRAQRLKRSNPGLNRHMAVTGGVRKDENARRLGP